MGTGQSQRSCPHNLSWLPPLYTFLASPFLYFLGSPPFYTSCLLLLVMPCTKYGLYPPPIKERECKWAYTQGQLTTASYITAYVCLPLIQCVISFSSVQSLSCVGLFASPWTAAHQAPLSFTISWCLRKLMSTELVM